MKKRMLATALTAVMVLAGSTCLAGDYYTKHKKSGTTFGEPMHDKALVYMIRAATMGMAIRTWSFYDDELIGVTRGRGYSFAHVPPGERLLWAKAENTSALTVNLEAGKTYYFKQKILPGLGKARVKLVPIDEATAAKMLRKCGWAEPTPEGRRQAAEIVANRLDRAERKSAKRERKSDG